jgi:superfamily I DNA/RNA helicase
MFPSSFPVYENASEGERLIFANLRKASTGKEWIVLHSLDLLEHVKKSQSEADFVVMIPGTGVLVLEVKSARTIKHDADGWLIGSKRETRGPFRQANEAMRSIMEYSKDANFDYSDVPFVYAVWFTHISKAGIESSIAWKENQILTSEDMKRDVTEVLKATAANLVKDLKHYKPNVLAPANKLRELSQILLPRFVAHQSPAERQRDVKDFLQTALKEQLEMVRLISEIKSVVLQGLAGTGKTHIAIHSARLAHERDERVLFLCYNRLLADHLRKQMENYPLVRVTSLHALMLEISELEVPDESDDLWWRRTLVEATIKNVESYSVNNSFDTLIIDEAQDLGTSEYLLVIDQLLEKGLAGSRIMVCGDFENQGVYLSGAEALENYKTLVPGVQLLTPLVTNCRNTEKVGDYLVAFLGLKPAYDAYRRKDQDSEIIRELLRDETEFGPKLSRILSDLLKKFTPDQVVVLSPQKIKLEDLMERIKIRNTKISFPKPGHVRVGSVHEFKGLEALAVVLVEFDSPNPKLRETFYVGATRSVHDFAYLTTESKLELLTGGGGNG